MVSRRIQYSENITDHTNSQEVLASCKSLSFNYVFTAVYFNCYCWKHTTSMIEKGFCEVLCELCSFSYRLFYWTLFTTCYKGKSLPFYFPIMLLSTLDFFCWFILNESPSLEKDKGFEGFNSWKIHSDRIERIIGKNKRNCKSEIQIESEVSIVSIMGGMKMLIVVM